MNLEKFAQLVGGKRSRWYILITWLFIIAVLNLTLPQANSVKNEIAPNLPTNAASEQAQKLAEDQFPQQIGKTALLTWYKEAGLSDTDINSIQSFAMELAQNPVSHQTAILPLHQFPLPVLKEQLISEDGTTLVLPVLFDENAETEEIGSSFKKMKEETSDIFPSNPFETKINDKNSLLVRITGPAGISVDATELFSQGDISLLIGTVVIVLLFLLVIYRSPILAIIPLIGVGMAYGVISPILGALGKAGFTVFDSQAISIMTVLLFGAGTDYCLFLIARYRTCLKIEEDKFTAMQKAIFGSTGAIAMSGLTVVFSLLVLLLAKYGSVHRFAITFSLAILIMMVASLTLVPAILSILGRASFYPFVPRTIEMEKERLLKKGKSLPIKKQKESFGMQLGHTVVKRPWQVTIITLILLSFFAFFATKIQTTYDTLSSFPEDMPSREGFEILAEHFSPGELAPVQVTIQTDGKENNVKEVLEGLSYVAAVTDPRHGLKDTNLVRFDVELNVNPYSNTAMNHLVELRNTLETSLKKAGISNVEEKVWIGGQTAEQLDTREITKSDSIIVIPVIIAMIAILLLFYLRSITTTIYLIGTVLLSYFSALGLGWLVLHYLFNVEAIQGFIPLYSFVFIVALGEDYNIFMISSIWKKSKEMPLLRAIKEGVAESGSVITSAGLILAGTFAVLTTLPIQILVHFGTITAIGVLLDTFIVRPFLVPAITAILGKWAFWPAKQRMETAERLYEKI